ncbi:cyclic AMP-dependent transcription factor ATF-2-like isoform X2 [Oscarella lobularis]|uniref:cyclic AMP-dependent transcription factor ATF-2-like isoform X2 n=1 Tax=Oscarella lobularis TaxID=121494 RepID=UPI003313C1BE
MSDEDKPFACSFSGCTQRFSNADHLEVHENKHQIKFGLQFPGRDQFLAGVDQTPTPTRFLEHGDRYGLFDALKGDEVKQPNPFEQAFRASTNGAATTPVHPVPPLPVTNPVKDKNPDVVVLQTDKDPEEGTTTLSVLETSSDVIPTGAGSGNESSPPSQPQSDSGASQRVYIPVAPSRTLANPSIPIPVATAPPNHLSKSSTATTTSLGLQNGAVINVKQQLKKNIVSQNPSLLEQAMARSKIGAPVAVTSATMATATTMTSSSSSQGEAAPPEGQKSKKRSRTRSEDMDPDEKRRRFLERNRAAATRCREKRKTWITGLEKKAQDVMVQNQQLTQEISFLRNEVAQLKSLLLAHKDCPVTLQQQRIRMQMQTNTVAGPAPVTGTTTNAAPSSTLFLLANNLAQPATSSSSISLAELTKSGQFVLQQQKQ